MKRWLCISLLFLFAAPSAVLAESKTPHAEAIGWRLGLQAFSFYRITYVETLDAMKELGIQYIEIIPFQRFSKEEPFMTSFNMKPEQRQAVLDAAKQAGVTIVSYGVENIPNDEVTARKIFQFGKHMDLERIVSEPPEDAYPLIDRLCEEYDIDVAIHNHPRPSEYWNPETVLSRLEGRSNRIGVCADTSHWVRSGFDVVEKLKLLEGRLKCFHFGDVEGHARNQWLAKFEDPDQPDPSMGDMVRGIPNVVYGEGPSDMTAWLKEIHRQKIKGVFCIEAFFERDAEEAKKMIVPCMEFFDAVAKDLSN
jgi:sugar phosphate isomerase/epimerase